MIINNNSYLLSSRPYLFGCEYGNIITINIFPKGPLSKIVRPINFSKNRLSDFIDYENRCGFALISLRGLERKNCHRLMTANEVPDLFSFLLASGYKIDTSLTKMMNNSNIQIDSNNIIAFISYDQ
jgi:hypothetical protein